MQCWESSLGLMNIASHSGCQCSDPFPENSWLHDLDRWLDEYLSWNMAFCLS